MASSTTYRFDKIVAFTVGKHEAPFHVREDRLRETSAAYRGRLQEFRRSPDGDCYICLEALHEASNELVFCKYCRVNFHSDCMSQWTAQANSTGTATCPTCRRDWPRNEEPLSFNVSCFQAPIFSIYYEWMHWERIVLLDDFGLDERLCQLIIAYLLGHKFEDDAFQSAVLQAMKDFVAIRLELPSWKVVRLAYAVGHVVSGSTTEPCPLRKAFVAMHTGARVWKKKGDKHPLEFVEDVGDAMGLRNRKRGRHQMTAEYAIELVGRVIEDASDNA
ncbi:hypothetical protein C7974DRAFT_470324 [Boeremia exigua]|uniref:uncharacterized protein n=1 Tax=Boeremia exigua TaxID=749465 RepID=UPI001E8DB856|nr:uncharacterized protein C7974DRAFT_470324 [Boeremia exigua]KAH6637390.1 hypothetical protein C7974DRAFT_470324 [Boeremia exigua]